MNLFQSIESFPANLTKAAYQVAVGAHIFAGVAVVGQMAQVVTQNQPLLNVAFGQQKGALAALAALAVGAAATAFTAHGDAIGAPSLGSAVNISADSNGAATNLNVTQALGNAPIESQASSIPGKRNEI